MKKVFLLLILVVFLCPAVSAVADEQVTVIMDGETIEFDVPAQIINGRTMVPVRKIFEKLGMEVEWNAEDQSVTAYKKGVIIQLAINDTTVYRNAIQQVIDVPAQIVNDRTLVPVRVVSECAGATVSWDDNTKTVYINSTNNIQRLEWNANYVYWGETDGYSASGYGMLFDAEYEEDIAQMGYYENSVIQKGLDFFSDDSCFLGTYKNGSMYNGTRYYSDGSTYTGDFLNTLPHGKGTFKYTDGSYHSGEWKEGLPDGFGEYYDAVEDVRYNGNFTNGKKNGEFVINDYFANETYIVTYENGVYIDEKQQALEELYKKVDELSKAYEALEEWYKTEKDKLYDYIQNGDPFSTDWASSIYENYGISDSSTNSSNLDSFAAANLARQQAALKAKADEAILQYNQTYIAQQKEIIEFTYSQQLKLLNQQREALLIELSELEGS